MLTTTANIESERRSPLADRSPNDPLTPARDAPCSVAAIIAELLRPPTKPALSREERAFMEVQRGGPP